tara:strand:- start:126 stop:530 length:405 start_codon:yes stop_codon:yes gene_type:complete
MANLRAGFTLSSETVLSSPLSISVGATLLADAGNLSRAKVLKTAVHNDALVVYKANDKLTLAYLYVKNMAEEKEKYIYIYNDTDSDAAVAKIAGQEFCFIPVAVDKTFKVYATQADTLVEYAAFGLDSSAVTLS